MTQEVLKTRFKDPWGPQGPFKGSEVKAIFIIMLRQYFLYPLSFSHEYSVTFSQGYVMGHTPTD